MSFLSLIQEEPGIFTTLCAVTGLMVGSFLNVVIFRLPIMLKQAWLEQCAELQNKKLDQVATLNIASPRSMCPNCRKEIGIFENIPIISYLFLKGKCSRCNEKISLRYPLVEAFTALISGLIAWHFGFGIAAFAALIFSWALIALAVIDFDTQLLPDDITLPLLWFGLIFNLANIFTDINSAVIGAIAGYLFLWSIFWIFKLTTGKEGMGYGDFKLLAAIGAWLGWSMLPLVILLSSLSGAIIGIGVIIFSKGQKNMPIPFGPFLTMGAIIALFWGNQLNHMYLTLF